MFGDITIDDLLERYTTPFARAIAACFQLRSCADLLQAAQPRLQGSDRIAAAILCGVREGWQDLPGDLREIPRDLGPAVTHRMAALAHRAARTGIRLGIPPARPLSLRELFTRNPEWGSPEHGAALRLARSKRWTCVETVIRLGAGSYAATIDRRGLTLVLDGEPRGVRTEVRREEFLDNLAGVCLTRRLDRDIRKQLGA